MPFLRLMATASFAVYFIHPWVLYFSHYLSIFEHFNYLPSMIGFGFTVPFVIAASLAIGVAFKLVMPNKSRFVIGW